MSKIYNHAPGAEVIGNRIRIILLVIMIAFFAYFAINNSQSEAECQHENKIIETAFNLEKGEYEAVLTVTLENEIKTIPVMFVVENDGEFGKVNLLNK